MEYLTPFLLVSYLLLLFLFIILNLINFYVKRNFTENHNFSDFSSISILIAMKNEAENLPRLFTSLKNLEYPEDKFEIILIDDNSTDGSYEKAVELSKEMKKIKILQVQKKRFPFKKGVLDYGIKFCNYDFIALTDADCTPEKDWLKKISDALKKYDFAFGSAPLIFGDSFVSKFASYENGKNQIANLIGLQSGVPFSATGRNFAYRKSSFEAIDGYFKTLDTISGDDDLLLREAFKNKLKIGFIEPQNASVFSNAVKTWGEYFKQKRRHVKTSHHYTLIQKLFTSTYFLSEIVLTYSFLLLPLNALFIFSTLLKFKISYSAIKKNDFFFYSKPKIHEFVIFELLFPVILIINFIGSFFYVIEWKNKKGEHN